MELHICVKGKTGRTWYACDSSKFHISHADPFDSEVIRLNDLYTDLEFSTLPYRSDRKIAPKKYRPWAN